MYVWNNLRECHSCVWLVCAKSNAKMHLFRSPPRCTRRLSPSHKQDLWMCWCHRTWPSPGPRILAEGSEGSLWILALGVGFASSTIWCLIQSTLLSHVEVDLAGREQSLSFWMPCCQTWPLLIQHSCYWTLQILKMSQNMIWQTVSFRVFNKHSKFKFCHIMS